MRQLTALDAQFLALESHKQCGHVSMLLVLDPSTRPAGRLEIEQVQQLVSERLPLLPPFRWRLRTVPMGLDYPYWIDDPDFDLEYHVRELALPDPATDAKLGEQIARIAARPLDRTRPLWELYLIHGLPDGHVAVMTKIHHAAVDGMSGAEILGVLLDLSPEGRESPAPGHGPGDPEPGNWEMFGRGMIATPRYLGRVLRAVPRVLPNLEDSPLLAELPGAKLLGRGAARVARTVRGGESRVLERSTVKPPKTSFNTHVSAHRRFAFGGISLADAKAVKNAHGCTLNDVVMSVCAGAVRRWLIEHDELPEGPLVAQIPVSVRTDEERGTFGNRVGIMSPPLYTNVADPIERLALTHWAMGAAKERHKATPAQLLQDSSEFVPPALFARATRVTMSLTATRKPIWNLGDLQRAGTTAADVLRWRRRQRTLPRLRDRRRDGSEHHRLQLLRQSRLRDRRRPRTDARRLETDRLARRVTRRAQEREPLTGPRHLQVNGIQLAVAEHGPADGPVVVLLHGFPELGFSWRHQVAPLAAAGYRVLVPDLRGYGDSEAPGAVEEYAIDVLAGMYWAARPRRRVAGDGDRARLGCRPGVEDRVASPRAGPRGRGSVGPVRAESTGTAARPDA